MHLTRNGFYGISKEDILQRLTLQGTSGDTDGIVLSYASWHGPVEIHLTDYPYAEHPFATSEGAASIRMGSRAEIRGASVEIDCAYTALNQYLGQFKLSANHPSASQLPVGRVHLLIDQQITEILRHKDE